MLRFVQSNLRWILPSGVIAIALLWALFRPELLFVNQSVNESLPTASMATGGTDTKPKQLSQGSFESLSHQTAGVATVYAVGATHTLRLTDFHTSNGPDVRVYLVQGADGKDNKTINGGGYLDLGTLKGNLGDQNYAIPAGTDLSKYQSVSIWCKRFAVNFGAASLTKTN